MPGLGRRVQGWRVHQETPSACIVQNDHTAKACKQKQTQANTQKTHFEQHECNTPCECNLEGEQRDGSSGHAGGSCGPCNARMQNTSVRMVKGYIRVVVDKSESLCLLKRTFELSSSQQSDQPRDFNDSPNVGTSKSLLPFAALLRIPAVCMTCLTR